MVQVISRHKNICNGDYKGCSATVSGFAKNLEVSE